MSNGPDDINAAIREKLQLDANRKLDSINNNEVDWFLRGSHILSSVPSSISAPSKPSDTGDTTPRLKESELTSNNSSVDTTRNESKVTETPRPQSQGAPLRKTSSSTFRSRSHSVSGTSLRKVSTTPQFSSSSDSNGASGGFFSRIKSKFSSSKASSNAPSLSSAKSPPISPVSKAERTESRSERNDDLNDFSLSRTNSKANPIKTQLSRSMSTPITQSNANSVDPRLEEYINYYKKQNSKAKRNFSVEVVSTTSDSNSQVTTSNKKRIVLDAAGNPIPPHPKYSPLPGALINKPKLKEEEMKTAASDQPKSKLSFLSRKKTNSTDNSLTKVTSFISDSSVNSIPSPVLEESDVPVLDSLTPLKLVGFDSSVFEIDPPQQIPSRNPRKGNVEISKTGEVIIHPLTEDEKLARQLHKGGGIVVGGTGNLRVIAHNPEDSNDETGDVADSDNHDNNVDAPPLTKTDIENQGDLVDPDEVNVSSAASHIGIDKPMVSRHKHDGTDEELELKRQNLTLEMLYTRCCHLREILPISSTLKQIPVGSVGPLPILQLKNPRPSLIEILTFADFVRVAPVACVSLDEVALSIDMFRILLSAFGNIEKLSLRNTPLDSAGWRLLCLYLSKNHSLNRLDITQCSPLALSNQRKKSSSVTRMQCNPENRSDMDWSLFTATIIARGGLEEIILSGCKIPDIGTFKKFMELAAGIKTARLGLAYNELTRSHMEIIAPWFSKSHSLGVDLGYNDLSDALQPIIDLSRRNVISNLAFVSFNSTNLSYNEMFIPFISSFVNIPSLKYLDLSNNKKLFPKIIPILASYLPSFSNLRRLILDYNDITTESLIKLCEILPFCNGLHSISLMGNKFDEKATRALCAALKESRSIYVLDLDMDHMPQKYQNEIGLYTMRNMEYVLYSKDSITPKETSLSGQLADLLANNGENIDFKSEGFKNFFERLRSLREEILEATSRLFKLQSTGDLNVEGKETLIRLCFFDSAIEKALTYNDEKISRPHNHVAKAITRSIRSENAVHSDDNTSSSADESPEYTQELKADDGPAPNLSRASSKTALNKLEKEEGSVLKLSNMHKDSSFENLKDLSGEEIRSKVLNTNDLSKIVDYLNRLKLEGISLEDVYQKDSNEGNCLKLENLKKLKPSKNIDIPDDGSINSDFSSEDEGTSETYDQLLKDLVKVKTKDV